MLLQKTLLSKSFLNMGCGQVAHKSMHMFAAQMAFLTTPCG